MSLVSRLLHTRALVRAPIALFKAGLGPLLGPRVLMLEHIGRVSGARRYVVLEVLLRPAPDRFVIVSGLGPRAQWYRNLLAHPEVRVSTGRHRLAAATVRRLPAAEAWAVFDRYAAEHPRLWRPFEQLMIESVGAPPAGEHLGDLVPVLEVDLT